MFVSDSITVEENPTGLAPVLVKVPSFPISPSIISSKKPAHPGRFFLL